MKYLIKILTLTFIPLAILFGQNNFYWKDAPIKGTKIYSIKFFNSNNGVAESQFAETLFTTDSGRHWSPNTYAARINDSENYLWSVEIYCSAMRTNDSGNTWEPYVLESQEHFCNTYFRDENTGWKVAEQFLSKVVSVINEYLYKGELDSLFSEPIQCTEYYTNAKSGWALGWCIRSFKNLAQM